MPPSNKEEAAAMAGTSPGSVGGTIAQFMDGMAGYYRHPKHGVNAPYDPRSRQRSGAGGVGKYSNLYRGFITQVEKEPVAFPGAGGKKQRKVYFQYNPTTISINYGIDTSVYPSDDKSPLDTAPPLGATAQTISWTLYFNRTYEMLQGDKKVGVMADVQSLEYLLGARNGQGLAAREIIVCFGMTRSGKPLAFGGWISDLNVEFLQFTSRMMPTVAMVQVGMVRRYLSSDTASGTVDNGVGATLSEALAKATATVTRGVSVLSQISGAEDRSVKGFEPTIKVHGGTVR